MTARARLRGLGLVLLPLLAFLSAASACGGGEEIPFGLKSEVVTQADNADAIVFAPDGRIFYAEQFTGNIRVITADGQRLDQPFAQVQIANWLPLEWGLTGLALDPDFAKNHYLYAFFTSPVVEGAAPTGRPMLVRFTDRDNQGVDRKVIIGDFPETIVNHQGFKANGKIHFGPDGLLYLTIGDYDQAKAEGPTGKPYALDLSSPVGKMLRVSEESGAAAAGNPFSDESGTDPRIFAYGFSKPFDFAFGPQGGAIYGVDNTASCEELNIVKSGGNYGWPDVGDFPFSDCTFGQQIKGIHFLAKEGMSAGQFLSGVGVSGLAFVSAAQYPALGDGLLVCDLTGILRRLVLSGPQLDQVSNDDVIVKDCKRSVAVSPDGTIYYSNDTEIRRLTIQKT